MKCDKEYNIAVSHAKRYANGKHIADRATRVAFRKTGVTRLREPSTEVKEIFEAHYKAAKQEIEERNLAEIKKIREMLI